MLVMNGIDYISLAVISERQNMLNKASHDPQWDMDARR